LSLRTTIVATLTRRLALPWGVTAVMIAGTSLLPGATDVMKVHHF
jgi:hypothetical protein